MNINSTVSLAVSAFAVSVLVAGTVSAQECATIQGGTLLGSDNNTISTGFDDWGYNYEARLFNGRYCDAYRDAGWCQPYADVELQMKWNDAWLSNRDCDKDGKLDRHFGYDSFKDSGAWETNHQSGWVDDANGKKRKWTYFVKIIAVESDDTLEDGTWMRDGVELGPDIWGEFAIVEEVYNDPSAGAHGILYKSPVGPGLGNLGTP